MGVRKHLFWWLALGFGCVSLAPAAETIERSPVYRSVSPHWTDLGATNYPFRTLFVDSIAVPQSNGVTVLVNSNGVVGGDGSGLTNLAAGNVSSGKLDVARLWPVLTNISITGTSSVAARGPDGSLVLTEDMAWADQQWRWYSMNGAMEWTNGASKILSGLSSVDWYASGAYGVRMAAASNGVAWQMPGSQTQGGTNIMCALLLAATNDATLNLFQRTSYLDPVAPAAWERTTNVAVSVAGKSFTWWTNTISVPARGGVVWLAFGMGSPSQTAYIVAMRARAYDKWTSKSKTMTGAAGILTEDSQSLMFEDGSSMLLK